MKRVKTGKLYIYEPVGMDLWDSRALVEPGTKVMVIHAYGCPPPNTMGHCHIATLDDKFAGLVLTNSLKEVK